MSIQEQLKEVVEGNNVVLFMKGSPDFPQCGFSGLATQILQQSGTKFASVDVLADNDVREGIKQYSNWPTIPQLYIKGEFIGGSDIIKEMFENGELKHKLDALDA
ncbi:MAG: Grx4 family monothiol glutaredoxin [Arenicellales bacterium]